MLISEYTPRLQKQKPGQKIIQFFKRHNRLGVVTAILGCMVGACLIAEFVYIHSSLQLDEALSLWQTSHSIGGTLRVVAQDVHVPLYHIILHFWQMYLGHGVPTLRLLSLIFFLATIPLVYILARFILNTGWALFATALFSFSPFMSWYASVGRMYTLLALMATLSQIYFLRIMQARKRAWKDYTITALVGAYSHYFFSFNLATQGIFYLFNRKRFAPGIFKRFIIVGLLVTLALAPWLIYFHSLGSAKNTAPLLDKPSTVDFFNAFSQFLFGFQDNYINTILVSGWPIVILAAFFAIKRGQRLTPEVSYLATAAFVPVILAYLLSLLVTPFFLSRYMISCVAPLIIIIIWLVSRYPRRFAAGISVVIIAVLIVTSIEQAVNPNNPLKEDYRGVALQVQQEAGPQDIVVLSAPFTVYPFEYYYNGYAQIDTLPLWNREAAGAIPAFNAKMLPSQVSEIDAYHRNVYLVLSQNQGYENTIRQYFLHHFPLLYRKTYSPDLSLEVFRVGYYQVPPLGSSLTIIKKSVATP